MDYTYKDLKHKKAAELKDIAKGLDHEAVKGYSQMNKDHLLEAICKALNIDTYEHHKAVGINKAEVKGKIKDLKAERDNLIEQHDHKKLKEVRREIKMLKNKLRQATV